ncbi:CRE-SRI-71 protein [Caenorhabditis remanei]|uniref:CRE-SRI-71 protein n=1 Tax=Caenorhabditis remanei TaxID=31234 RepID=E3M1S0_CAERE|nr:CRE-SRI-71 protein [Caenorhabditis remanei]
MHNIDFSEPRWLLNYYHVIGFTSLVLNSLGIYLLIFQNSKLGNFRYYLLILQVACTLTDIHLSFLMQPVSLYPLLAGYTVGILSNYLDISTHICALIAGFIALVQLESLTLCFGKKHQAIASILKVHIVPNPILYSCYALCIICPFGLCASLQYLYMTHDEQLNYIEKNLPELLHDFSTLSHFVIYVKSPNLTWLYILVFTGGSTLFVLFVLFISDIFRLMRELKLKISISTYQKHHEALHSLMVQFATSILCLAPPCILVIIVYFEIENGKVIAESLIAWFASHSSVNMISLCLFFPPYRKFFWRSLNR